MTATPATTFGHTHDLTGFAVEIQDVFGVKHGHDHAGGDQHHDHGWGKAYNRDGKLVGDAAATGPVDKTAFPDEAPAFVTPEQRRIAELEKQVADILAANAPNPSQAPE